MDPSNDFRQMRLPLDARKPVAYRPPWMPSNTPEHSEALRMIAEERRRLEDMRARFIDQICDQYREGGSEIRLVRPDLPPRDLTLVVNGKVAGVFVEEKSGLVFRQCKGE